MKTSVQNQMSYAVQSWLTSEASRRSISSHQTEFLNQLMAEGFPTTKHEEYRFTPVTRALENLAAAEKQASDAAKSSSSIPEIPGSQARIIVTHDKIILPAEFPAGISVLITENKPFSRSKDAFALLNQSLSNRTLEIGSDSHEDRVIHLHHATDHRFCTPAISVRVNAGAQLTLIETYAHPGRASFVTHVLDASVEACAKFTWYSLQDFEGETSFVSNVRIVVQNDAEATGFVVTSGGAVVRNNPVFEVAGAGAVANLFGLSLLNGRTLADHHTVVDHQVANASSNELYKSIMAGHSRGVFNGKIFVRPDAQKTNAFQSNRNILLSENATVNTKPQLEIWADDVKCSHGCTSGQLDEEALFYLRSRGIDRPAATALLLEAFAGEVVDKLPHEQIRNMIRTHVIAKLALLA